MSCCTKSPMACIFCSCVVFDAVNLDTSCLISGDASTLSPTRLEYHFPIVFQSIFALRFEPPDVKKDTIIWPLTPRMGGMNCSFRIPVRSFTVHCQVLLPASVGFTSGWLSQETLYSHPGGSWSEERLSRP